jgi:O-antigen/teichoic acid export membrane protein
MTRRSIKVSAYLLSPLLVGLAVCGESFVSLILTDKWLGCVPFLQIISITYLFMPMHKANLQAIKALGRSDIVLRLEYIKKGFGITVVIIATFVFRSTIAIAWSFFVATIFNAVVNAWPNVKLLNYTIKEQFSDLLPNFGAAAIMGGLVWCMQLFGLKTWITLAVQIVVGVLSYLAISILFHMESFTYVKNVVKGLFRRKKEKKA